MSAMFQDCSNLSTLYLDNFDTSNYPDMSFMFNRCYRLTTSMRVMSTPTYYDGIFNDCSTEPGAEFTLNYTSGLEYMAKKMIETAHGNSNVKLGELKQ